MDVREVIRSAAEKHGVSPETMIAIAQLESGLNPNAQNPNSTAGGLFQFINSTAGDYGLTNKLDPVASADAAARLALDNTRQLERALGRPPTAGELYLAHQQGSGGAQTLLQNPNALAVDLLGAEKVRLNVPRGTDWQNMTGQDFANLWVNKANSALGAINQAAPQQTPNFGGMLMGFGQSALNNLSMGQKLSLLGQKNNLQAAGNAMGLIGALPGMLGQRAQAAGNWLADNVPGGDQVRNLMSKLATAPRPQPAAPQQAGFMLARNLMNPQSAGALASGNAGYSLGGTVLPTIARNGMARNTYGDTGGSIASMGGSSPYWDAELGRMVVPGKQ